MADVKSAGDELLEQIQSVRAVGYHGHADRLEKAYVRLARETYTRQQIFDKLADLKAPAGAFETFGIAPPADAPSLPVDEPAAIPAPPKDSTPPAA